MDVVSELKRRLDDNGATFPKRLRLAENVVATSYFPAQKKDEVVVEWLISKLENSESGDDDFHSIVKSLTACFKIAPAIGSFSSDVKSKIVKVVTKQLNLNPIDNIVECVVTLLNNESSYTYFCHELNIYLSLTKELLSQLLLGGKVIADQDGDTHIILSDKHVEIGTQIFDNVRSFFKMISVKVQFIEYLIDSKSLEVIFQYFNVAQLKQKALHLCQDLMFPAAQKTFYSSLLAALIKTDNVNELLERKGENVKFVHKVMNTFFVFHSKEDFSYLDKFIESFVYSYKNDSSLIFVLYCVAFKCINLKQTYLNPLSELPVIKFPEHKEEIYKKEFFLKSLYYLKNNEIDLNIKLIHSIGENFKKNEIKKYFTNFLQEVTLDLLKGDGNVDVMSLKIFCAALKLDPAIVDTKMDELLPKIMCVKKKLSGNDKDLEFYNNYKDMLIQLIETLFKLSKGIEFVPKMLPLIVVQLEAINSEQSVLRHTELTLKQKGKDTTKVVNKIITGEDVFPEEFCNKFGKLSSEATLRQNLELFDVLKKLLEKHCLNLLAEGLINPSVVVTAEMLCQLLSNVLDHCRMAEHSTVPAIGEKFWLAFQAFQDVTLKQFGETLLELSYDERLKNAFLHLSLCFGNLKLLNLKYSNIKLMCQAPEKLRTNLECTLDFSLLLPFLSKKQWLELSEKYQKNSNEDSLRLINSLILQKIVACDIVPTETYSEIYLNKSKIFAKQYLLNNFSSLWQQLENNEFYITVLLSNLDSNLINTLSTTLIEKILHADELEIFNDDGNVSKFLQIIGHADHKSLLNTLLMECLRRIWEICECSEVNPKLSKNSLNEDFNFTKFIAELDNSTTFIEKMSSIEFENDAEELQVLRRLIYTIKKIPTKYLSEEHQLMTIFTIVIVKKIIHTSKSRSAVKTIKRDLDFILLSIFEMSPTPDIYKIFPIKYIFSFGDNSFIDLVTLKKLKTSNVLFVIITILESATKRIKTDSEVIKSIVKVLTKNQRAINENSKDIEFFSNKVFQITCLLLPLISKAKKVIKESVYRSILVDLEDKLHKSLLKLFENVKLDTLSSDTGNIEDSVIGELVPEEVLATLNAVESYSLILAKYLLPNKIKADEEHLNNLLRHLGYFVTYAISALNNRETKTQHLKAAIQLIIVVLNNKSKLLTHPLYKKPNALFLQVWQALKNCLLVIFAEKNINGNTKENWNGKPMQQIGNAVECLCKFSDIEFFNVHMMKDLADLSRLKDPITIISTKNTKESSLTHHEVAKYFWTHFLKEKLPENKVAALTKNICELSNNLNLWLRSNFKSSLDVLSNLPQEREEDEEDMEQESQIDEMNKMDLEIAKIVRLNLDILTEVTVNTTKVDLTFITMDHMFEIQQSLECFLPSRSSNYRRPESLEPFFIIFEGSLNFLNSLIFARREITEDRWPSLLQCYRLLLEALCRQTRFDVVLDKLEEEQSSELAHGLEKLTKTIVNRKDLTSHLAAYLVADISTHLGCEIPTRVVRQHVENSALMLIEISDSPSAMGFLKRGLATTPGEKSLTNLYDMYQRYHKYKGTA